MVTVCAAVVIAVGVGACSKEREEKSKRSPIIKRPNIILITVESLRTDHVACYGGPRETTPNIDALANEAILYEDAHAVTSWTLTSHASIFTGLYPTAHGVVRERDRLNDSYRTVAEILADYGYQTGAVVGGPYLKKNYGLDRGFQHYDQSPAQSPKRVHAHNDITNPRMEARVNHFLDNVRRPDDPFFLFLYYWDPHYQYIPPPPYDSMFVPKGAKKPKRTPEFHRHYKLGKHITEAEMEYVKAQYDGEIRCTDEYLGRLFGRLREMGIWDNTIVILTADHGEQFFEHGFLGHKFGLHVESLHVPLIVKLAGQAQPRRDQRLVSLIDLFPTMLELGLCRVPDEQHGLSLLSAPRAPLDPMFHELVAIWYMKRKSTGESWSETEQFFSVREDDYKLIWNETSGDRALYDIIKDPGELHPIGEGGEERAARLVALIEDWRAEMRAVAAKRGTPSEAVLSPEDEEQLRSLGYIK